MIEVKRTLQQAQGLRKKRVQKLVRQTFGDALTPEAKQELYKAFLSKLSKNKRKEEPVEPLNLGHP